MPPPQDKVKHVVVLMLENRSFDHMLGGVKFAGPVEQPTGSETNPGAAGSMVKISFDADAKTDVGPDHSHLGVMWQLTGAQAASAPPYFQKPYGINNRGFVRSFEQTSIDHNPPIPGYGSRIMRCHPESHVPVLATLAREYAVCDHWFCSVPGETWPNRNYAHSGTSDGETNIQKRTFTNDTIFNRLDNAKKRWRVYHDGIAQIWVFPKLWTSLAFRGRFHSIDRLEEDVAARNLPEYTFIEPRHFGKKADSQHPDNEANERSFHAGEALIKRVYDALRANPSIWNATLLIITYDEHGGFYDHVPPPTTAVRPDNKESEEGFLFDMLGVRVPTVLVSPWIPKGTVDSNVYDHSSIPRTVRARFAPMTQPLSAREAVANTIWHNLSLAKPRTDLVALAVSAAAEAKVSVATPVKTLAIEAGSAQEGLAPYEEPYAWLAFTVAKTIEKGAATGVHTLDAASWQETDGQLITTKKAAAEYRSLAKTAGPGPVILTDSDLLSAFGMQVADMLHESGREFDDIVVVPKRKVKSKTGKKKANR